MARYRQVRSRRGAEPAPHEPCAVCRASMVKHQGEHPYNFARRRTCGSPECVQEWRTRKCGNVFGPEPDAWWLEHEPLRLPPDAFADDPRAAAPEPPIRLVRPDRVSYAGNRWAEMDET